MPGLAPALAMCALVALGAWAVAVSRTLADLQAGLAARVAWQAEVHGAVADVLGADRARVGGRDRAARMREVERRLLHLQDEFARTAPDDESLHGLAREARAAAADRRADATRPGVAAPLVDRLHALSERLVQDQSRLAADLDAAWIGVQALAASALLLGALAFALGLALVRARGRAREAAAALASAQTAAEGQARLVSTLAHEVRNPITALLGTTELLAATDLTTRQRDLADVVERAGRSLADLTDSVLDLARIDAGRLELAPAEMDVLDTVEAVAMLFAGRAEEKGLDLSVTVEAGVPSRVLQDPVRLRQVLTNVVGNAVKFTTEGEVAVHVTREGGRNSGDAAGDADGDVVLVVSVRDTGPGVPPESRERIFEAFDQGDGASARRHGGSGLGLAISRRLVERMGGRITLEDAPGRGVVFRVTLPCGRAPGGEAAEPRPEPSSALLAGGSARDRDALLRQLAAWGWKVETAAGSGEAVSRLLDAAARGETPRVAVVGDADLEAGDLAREIRRAAPGAGTSLVRLVTFSQGQATGTTPESLFAARLARPIRPSRLVRALGLATGHATAIRTAEAEAPPTPRPARPEAGPFPVRP